MKQKLSLGIAYGSLIFEYLGRTLWRPLSIAALFVALAAFDILPLLNPWLHGFIVLLFAGGIAASLRIGLRQNRWPDRGRVLRRVEQDSGLPHRPFDALEDRPVVNHDAVADALWQQHRERVQANLSRLKVGAPRSHLAALDAQAWRGFAVLILLIGLVFGSGRLGERLDAALSPPILGTAPARSIMLDAWITPPDYTALPPLVLARETPTDEIAEVPAGSKVEAHVSGGTARPHIIVNGVRQKFTALDRHNFQVIATIQSGDTLKITQGWRTLGSWRLTITQPSSPVIAWVSPPVATDKNEVKLDYTAADQYGLASIEANIKLADAVKGQMLPKGTALDVPGADEFTLDISGGASHAKSIKTSSVEDWTSNIWAGFPVTITLNATGLSGLTAHTEAQDIVLPERKFTNPVAREIIAERKRLTLDPVGERVIAAGKIAKLASQPDAYHGDTTIFLVLHVVAERLWKDTTLSELRSTQDMMWQAAIQLEEGSKSEQEKSVANAADALRQALNQNAPQSEIDKLTKNLKQALNQYLDQLQKELQQRLARGEKIPMAPPGAMNRQQLNDMLDQMQNLSKNGSRDAAKNMLSELQNMMRNLQAHRQDAPDEKSQQAMQDMQKLQDLTQRQQQLMDKTYRRSRGLTTEGDEMQRFHRDPFDPRKRLKDQADDNGADEQQRLKNDLQSVEKDLDGLGMKLPKLKGAESDMGDAKGKLNGNKYADALPSQQSALDKLRDSLQSMAQQMRPGQGEGGGLALGNGSGGGQEGREGHDPLGRPGNGTAQDQQVKIPDDNQQDRVRAIIEELRKRSADRSKSRSERDYIDRLLKGF